MSAYTHYLRIEGVNLGRSVFDTRDLNTIRGGGLLLLDAVRRVKARLTGPAGKPGEGLADHVETVSEGASAGLFAFSPRASASDVRDKIADFLREDAQLRHGTFVVDIFKNGGDNAFRTDAEKVLALNRWQQMQSGSLAIPAAPENNLGVCQLDGLRPAVTRLAPPEKDELEQACSLSVRKRRSYGQDRKQTFYADLTKLSLRDDFAHEFEEIAGREDNDSLTNKMAVFYADGNGFGSLQRRFCRTKTQQIDWDTYVRRERTRLMTALLRDEVTKDSAWLGKRKKGGKTVYRFETLLWGGDEMLFVVPAWKGWRIAQMFFDLTAGWSFGGEKLTHTAALVFCHHHSPIHRIKYLAKEKLAEFAKEESRKRNQLVYQVLESFDHLGTDLKAAWELRIGRDHAPERLILASREEKPLGDKLKNIAENLRTLRDSEFPRGQLRAIVGEIVAGRASGAYEDHAPRLLRRAGGETSGEGAALQGLCDAIGGDWALWIHLEELWDYALA